MSVSTEKLVVVDHPLVEHKLGLLRDDGTPTHLFRQLVDEVTLLLTYEATKDLATEQVEIDTPLERTTVQRISGKKVAVCPILRAGIGMLDGVLSLISGARRSYGCSAAMKVATPAATPGASMSGDTMADL